ncbi:unnamed protein product [Arctogadus glacialis]
MAEPRKVFQMEKGHIEQAMDAFWKAWAEHQKHRKREGFECEVFWLEGSDLLHGEERDRSEERSIPQQSRPTRNACAKESQHLQLAVCFSLAGPNWQLHLFPRKAMWTKKEWQDSVLYWADRVKQGH